MWLNMSRATLTEHTGQICMIDETKGQYESKILDHVIFILTGIYLSNDKLCIRSTRAIALFSVIANPWDVWK